MIARPMTMYDAILMKDEINVPLVDDGRGFVIQDDEGRELAKVMCCNFTENSCFVHMVIRDSAVLQNNYLAREIFHFTFTVLGRTMLLATASSLNEGSLALQRGYGFEEVCRIADAFSDGDDMVISKLTHEKFLSGRIH